LPSQSGTPAPANAYNVSQGLVARSVHFENPSGANTSGNGQSG
jgi:hypothetical protein